MQSRSWQAGSRIHRLRSWDDFGKHLAAHLRQLAACPGRYLVIAGTNSTRYVQFASLTDGAIEGEAVGNDNLAQQEQLNPPSCRRLIRLGWQGPDASAAGKRNFCRQWPPPAPVDAIVALALQTLRDIFAIPAPAAVEIRRGSFASPPATSTCSLTQTMETGAWIPPRIDAALHLPPGSVVRNAISGRQYCVGHLLGAGGFGAVYRVAKTAGPEPLPGECVLKVALGPEAWHRESYFGELLRKESGIVRIHESFAWVPRGKDRGPLYCLVSELVEGGDLAHHLGQHPVPWPESRARREIARLARAVSLLHASGAVHRDITPKNVFVTPGGVLKLGDFGIALHRVGSRHVAADAFARWFAPEPIRGGKTVSWRPADDVYHLGQLFAILLSGSAKSKLTADVVKALPCTPEAKSVIQRCIGERRKRFANAAELLAGLEKRPPARSAVVRSLEGKRVVFTGALAIPRKDAKLLVKKAGGTVENQVGSRTDVVVLGAQSSHWKAERKGQKLLDVDRELERGHPIAVITERRFLNLLR
jgi:serine/threonine-protein kinase